MGAPVDDAFAAIDKAFFIILDENFLNGLRATLIESKSLTGPVAGRAELFKLGIR